MAKTPDWMDAHAARNLELTLQALAAGEYGEPYLDLDTELFRKYRDGQQDALLSETWLDKPTWDHLMSRVRPGDHVLCLAGAGGQQSVIYSLLGADVTVFDLTPEQLHRDRVAARHYGYEVETIQGDMRDLSVFEDNRFCWVHQPISLLYVPDLTEVYRAVNRVLGQGGRYCSQYTYPAFYLAEDKGWDGTGYVMRFSQPQIGGPLLERESDGLVNFEEGISFGETNHLLSDIVNGQVSAGLVIKGLWEDPRPGGNSALDGLKPGSASHKQVCIPFGITTIAEKP
ncbi:MAG: class I SAM-dependent methyltransferase [Gammaproteobacteria bacterium]|nr:class I SAM-dependent methyltransferase [Gammaproteobacteria bacterium]